MTDESLEGWDHIYRSLGDMMFIQREEDTGIIIEEPVNNFFGLYFEDGKSLDQILSESDFSDEKIREALNYSIANESNLHEVARKQQEKRKMLQRAKESTRIEDQMEITLEEDEGSYEIVTYLNGSMSELQDLVEEKVRSRDFKIRYKPTEDQSYRGNTEFQVVEDAEAGDEVYVGVEDGKIYVGSTLSEIDREFENVEDAEAAVNQELNNLIY